MKTGIVTINGLFNYGNRLQNYAVTSVLRKLGQEAESLIPLPLCWTWDKNEFDAQAKEEFEKAGEGFLEENYLRVKRLRFKDFNEAHMPRKLLKKYQYDKEVADEYDYFVTGSDQVFNPLFKSSVGQMENNLLSFAPANKRVCFAPSVGVDDIPKKWYPVFEKELDKFPYLSVREESGADLIEKILGKRPQVVIDPTLMIEKEEWLEVAKPLEYFDYSKDYILYYFLGDKDEEMSGELKDFIEKQKVEKSLRDVCILDTNDKVVASAGPAEFVHLFANAKMVVTDSFHGAVFAIIMGKPLVSVDRKLILGNDVVDMSARLNTLLKNLLLDRKLCNQMVIDEEHMWECDYEESYGKLRILQKEAMDFLKKSMKIKG